MGFSTGLAWDRHGVQHRLSMGLGMGLSIGFGMGFGMGLGELPMVTTEQYAVLVPVPLTPPPIYSQF